MRPFVALDSGQHSSPLLVVDIGYSAKAKSCGLAWTGVRAGIQVTFGQAIQVVAEQLARFDEPVLVLEAVLSTFHNSNGNPEIRGAFERGTGWYWGPGAVSLVAARRFLEELAQKFPPQRQLLLAEAFLSNKPRRTGHIADAVAILEGFWSTQPEELRDGVEPTCSLIQGVPPIRVFETPP